MPWPVSPAESDLALNPEARAGVKHAENNFNFFLHPPSEHWPWQGTALIVHLLRFCSVILGVGSLLCIYATGRLIWRAQPGVALLAVAMTAALPQWLFLHSAMTNDTLLIFFVTLIHCYLTYLWFAPLRPKRFLLLGILMSFAILTKNTGLLLLPYTALFLLAKYRWRVNRQFLVAALTVAIPVLLLTVWLFWRNEQLYGDPTAVSRFIELAGGERQLPAWFIIRHLDLLWLSSIAHFGWMNVPAPSWVYIIRSGLLICAAMGSIWGILWSLRHQGVPRSAASRRVTLLTLQSLWPLGVFVAWFQFNLRTPAEQGRLLFPAILPVALWVGYGLGQWRPRLLSIAGIVAAMISALYCVAVVMPAAYPRPTFLAAPPDDVPQLNQSMGLGIELVAARAHTAQLHPGDAAKFTLYWRATEAVEVPPLVSPELLGRQFIPVGQLAAAYHGGGMFRANEWRQGQVIAENISIQVADDARVPTLGRLYLRLQGQEPLVNAAFVKLVPRRWPTPSPTILAEFANGIEIAQAAITISASSDAVSGVLPGATLPVSVRWQIRQPPHVPLNTFVHLGQPGLPPLAQADGPALHGDYPAHDWDAGAVFDDEYLLTVPADLPFGEYAVMIGLYRPESGERIALTVDGERPLADALMH
jgi:hypothetical protein